MFPIILAALAAVGLVMLIGYFRPPQGDVEPLGEEALANLLRGINRRGQVPDEAHHQR